MSFGGLSQVSWSFGKEGIGALRHDCCSRAGGESIGSLKARANAGMNCGADSPDSGRTELQAHLKGGAVKKGQIFFGALLGLSLIPVTAQASFTSILPCTNCELN